MNMSGAADALRKAMKGFGTDEKALIQVLAPLGPLEVESVKAAFRNNHKRDLIKDVHSETSSYFREGLEAIIRGPLEQDCYTLREGLSGMGTKEALLDEVLLGRTNADINAIKRHYSQMYQRSLESDMKSDLSGKTERLYDMVLAARRTEESAPINPQQIDQNVNDLYKATEGKHMAQMLHIQTFTYADSYSQAKWEPMSCKSVLSFVSLPIVIDIVTATDHRTQHPHPPSNFAPSLTHINAATNALSPNALRKSSPATWRMLFFTWCTARLIRPRYAQISKKMSTNHRMANENNHSTTQTFWKPPCPVPAQKTKLSSVVLS